jgi:hypothetical protein
LRAIERRVSDLGVNKIRSEQVEDGFRHHVFISSLRSSAFW